MVSHVRCNRTSTKHQSYRFRHEGWRIVDSQPAHVAAGHRPGFAAAGPQARLHLPAGADTPTIQPEVVSHLSHPKWTEVEQANAKHAAHLA